PSGRVYNIGSGGTQSINRLVSLLGGPVEYIPKRPGEPDRTFADVSLVAKELNWSAKVDFENGVERMLAAIDAWRDAPVWDAASIEKATKTWFERLGAAVPVGSGR
ncbi:MAG: NAD-dependent dehydratase, partial [Vulcanimicrobiaceae bacterium]